MAIQIKEEDIPNIKITIDLEKCQLPQICNYKCYEKCPQGVFHVWTYPNVSGKFMKPDPNSPKHYGISSGSAPKCVTCMKCTENCPQDAITIEIQSLDLKSDEHPYRHPFESLEIGLENQKLIDQIDANYRRLVKK